MLANKSIPAGPVREHYSCWTSVWSGLPQGTVLGPILFLIYIKISQKTSRQIKLFTDDMKVYRVLRNTKKNVKEQQKDLTRLESWSNDCELQLNTDECEVMPISKTKMTAQAFNIIYVVII